MKISENVKKVLVVLAVIVGVVLLIRFAGAFLVKVAIYLFGLLSPFIFGYIIARLINPVATKLQKWLRIPRGISAILVIIFTVGILGGLLTLLGIQLFEEIKKLYINWEMTYDSIRSNWNGLSSSWGELYRNMPDFARNVLNNAITGIYNETMAVTADFSVMDTAQVVAKSLPAGIIWAIMFILALFFMVSKDVRLTPAVRKLMGDGSANKLEEIKTQCKMYLGGYVKAQMILMVIAFFVILIILSLFRAPFALLVAALTAILDALPFFGSGIVLWPLAVIYLVDGNILLAVGYVITYFAIMLLRRVLEPKLVSDRMGFDNPIIMLVVMYMGYKIWGVIGLIIGPIILMIIISLYKVGLFNRIIAILKQLAQFTVKEFKLFEEYMHNITK